MTKTFTIIDGVGEREPTPRSLAEFALIKYLYDSNNESLQADLVIQANKVFDTPRLARY